MKTQNKIKNTWWNRLFHQKIVEANVKQKKKLQKLIGEATGFIEKIGVVDYNPDDTESAYVTGAQDLMDVFHLHKEAWAVGFQNEKIGPDEFGMFRCKSIETMIPENVYIGGNLWGLNTHTIPEWEKCKNEGKTGGGYPIYMYLTEYQIVLQRYKNHLTTNIKATAKKAEEELKELVAMGY